ncbi:extracellular solute-binding protein [Dactylosporangium fulvum]|uniref:Extracellular solute-binding protein n=1 Tax=Dactylosporangium fulvum TaxID=53359 RepID=A0ABY5W158_9ACTN|nr:extracellular solute-binding protein [Dactylosporangium fulvum]UWP83120.1 extracellular solute-binding protein [Dactylosporangium fulvum]
MRTLSTRVALGALALGLAVTSTACASSDDAGSDGTTTITVMGIPPTTKAAARQAYLDQVAAFEQANPKIKIETTDAAFDPTAYATQLAGGNAPSMLLVALTEPAGLIARRQVADLTTAAEELTNFKQFDPRVLDNLRDSAGKLYGIPTSSYALGLVYNRKLFIQAGLDPARPPTTWDELAAAAKQITDRTGVPGFAEMTVRNGGGWRLTAGTYSRGGAMQVQQGEKFAATVDNPQAVAHLTQLQRMRWQDKSMGTNQLLGYDDVNSGFAAGKFGMIISDPGYYASYLNQYKGDPANFGAGAYPQAGGNATLIGGQAAMVNPKASAAQRAAALKWVDFYYLRPQYEPTAAAERARSNKESGIPVGVPTVALFNTEVQQRIAEAVKPYVTVDQANFAPFLTGTASLQYKPEPPVEAQKLYAALDTTVQAVLTRQDADPAAELAAAQKTATTIVEQAQR